MSKLVSQICRFSELNSPDFRYWIEKELRDVWRTHRKQWEQAYVCQALYERNCLQKGKRGLCFATGREPLPNLFIKFGCKITATDLDVGNPAGKTWKDTGQLTISTDDLYRNFTDRSTFDENIELQTVDMNHIPSDLTGYDFTWSTCSYEHCGSIHLGIQFIDNQMKCLKPGGVAVHTTEYNMFSPYFTITEGNTVLYRYNDMVRMVNRLERQGYEVEPLDINNGNHELDTFMSNGHAYDKHLRLFYNGYCTTSIGIIIRKPESFQHNMIEDKV